MNDILIVSDMSDLRNVREANRGKFNDMEFVFSSRDGHKLMGWVPDNIHITIRAQMNMAPGVEYLLKTRVAQGSKLCPVS